MSAKKILAERKNRKCKAPGCKRVLSIYNRNDYCHVDWNRMARSSDRPACESAATASHA
jgi:hypothetical protein